MKRADYGQTVIWKGQLYQVIDGHHKNDRLWYDLQNIFVKEVHSVVPSGEMQKLHVYMTNPISLPHMTIPLNESVEVIRLQMTLNEKTHAREIIGAFVRWHGKRAYLKRNEFWLPEEVQEGVA
ncbi:MAG: hypothetical protein ACPG7F_21725 [Aggregatilineales bacterium]